MTNTPDDLRAWLDRARTASPSTETAVETAVAVYQSAAAGIDGAAGAGACADAPAGGCSAYVCGAWTAPIRMVPISMDLYICLSLNLGPITPERPAWRVGHSASTAKSESLRAPNVSMRAARGARSFALHVASGAGSRVGCRAKLSTATSGPQSILQLNERTDQHRISAAP